MPSYPLPRSVMQDLIDKATSGHVQTFVSDYAGAGKSFQIRKGIFGFFFLKFCSREKKKRLRGERVRRLKRERSKQGQMKNTELLLLKKLGKKSMFIFQQLPLHNLFLFWIGVWKD